MNFGRKTIIKEEPLWLTFLFVVGMLRCKPIRLFFKASFLICSIIFVIELYTLYINPMYCVKYGPWMMVKQLGFVCLWGHLMELEKIGNMWQHLDLWTFDSAGPVIEEEIIKVIKNHHQFVIFAAALCGTYSFLVLLPNPSDKDFYLIQLLVEQNYPKFATVFCCFGKIIHGPICCGMLLMPLMVIYSEQHSIYQCKMFVEHLRNLSWDFQNYKDAQLLHNASYQKLIHARLKFCIIRHMDFLSELCHWSICEFMNENGRSFIVNYEIKLIEVWCNPGYLGDFLLPNVQKWFPLFMMSSMSTGIGLGMLTYALYSNILHCTLHNLAIVAVLGAITLTIFCRVFHSGQAIENESGKLLLYLNETRWLSWNKSNRMMLLMMMQNAREPMQLVLIEEVVFNYELAIRMVRSIYSVISVFTSIR